VTKKHLDYIWKNGLAWTYHGKEVASCLKVTLHIKDNRFRNREEMEMFVHDVRRIASIGRKDPLRYSYIQDDDTHRLSKAFVVFNVKPDEKDFIISNINYELGDSIYSIDIRRGDIVNQEDTGTDFD
jgi:hypothetical protein